MRVAAAALLLIGSVFTLAPIGAPAGTETVEPALARFLTRPDEPLRSYRALRRMQASNPRFNVTGVVEAVTELHADGRFEFRIVREEGSDYIRNRVLRPMLQNEEKLFATGNPDRAALTSSNYHLAAGDVAEPGVVKLVATPRRRDIALFQGALFVTSGDADLVRVEGRLAKNPSFWTTRVDLVRRYARLGGIRVPVRLDTTAQIRIAGASTMSVVYEYETINGALAH